MSNNLKTILNVAAGKVANFVLNVGEALDDFEDSIEDSLELKKDLYLAAKGIRENEALKSQLLYELGEATYAGDKEAVSEISLRIKDAEDNIAFFTENFDEACNELGLCEEDESDETTDTEEPVDKSEGESENTSCKCGCCCDKTETPPYVYCGKCGAKHASTNAFCTKCGNSLD